MMIVRWLLMGLLIAGLAKAQDKALVDPDAASDADSEAAMMQEQRTLLRAAAAQVADGREAWLLANMLSVPQTQTQTFTQEQEQVQDHAVIAALRARAASAQASDPLLLRQALSRDLSHASAPDTVDALLAQLEALDPGNAINSLTAMIAAPKDYTDPIYDQRVQELAAASHYSSDYLSMLRASYALVARVHGLAAIPSEADVEAHPADVYHASIAAVGVAAAYALPAFQHLIRACDMAQFPLRAESCQRIGELVFDDAGNLLERAIAVSLLEHSAINEVDRMRAQALRRESDWQMAAFQELMFRPRTERMDAQDLRFVATTMHGDELEAMRELFAAHDVPLTPPADWQSARSPR